MYIIVFITAADRNESRRISRALIEHRLCACVTMTRRVSSVFRWKGKVDAADEVLMVVKSTKAKLSRIVALVKSVHSYAVPEIIAVPVIGGNRDYLDWIDESIG